MFVTKKMNCDQQLDICAICLDPVRGRGRRKIYISDCQHRFHATCFEKLPSFVCPCCRSEVTPTPIHQLKRLRKYEKCEKDKLRVEKRACYWECRKQEYLIEILKEKVTIERQRLQQIKQSHKETILTHQINILETQVLIRKLREPK